MNRQLLLFLCLLMLASGVRAQVQYTTETPRVEDVNDPDVTIQRVELTSQYTVIYMKFESGRRRQTNPGQYLIDGNTIGFQPTARLYVNQGERSYKLIRTENIPAETRLKVQPGERVDFVAYFERIDPGYTVFDLFECKDYVTRNSRITCFNFWGVHIINPVRKTYSQRIPKPQVVPRPPVQPRYQPRTTPGIPTSPDETTAVAQPKPELSPIVISGLTRNAKTKRPIPATVTYRLLSGAESAGNDPADSVRSSVPAGQYTIPIDRRGVYAVSASAKGYFSQSDTLATNRVNVNRNFDLVPIEAGATITLKNLYFNVSEFDLKPESYPELDRLAGVLHQNPTMTIRLEGHTDTVGDFDANVELSRNRVNEVKRYLVAKGISTSRIETIGYGPSRPINTNKSLKERPENRRVEMVITKV